MVFLNKPFKNNCSLMLFPSYSFNLVILKPLEFNNNEFSSVSEIFMYPLLANYISKDITS